MSKSRRCACCGNSNCNKIYRVPVGKPTRRIFRICGRCIIHNAEKTRRWLDEQEGKLK